MSKNHVPLFRSLMMTVFILGASGSMSASAEEPFCVLKVDGLSCEADTGEVTNVVEDYASGRYCTLSGEAARFACLNEAEDDRWIAVGNCMNSTDPFCIFLGEEEYEEELQLCTEQFEARLEICESLGEAKYDPVPDPMNFVDPAEIGEGVDPNPYFPLVPGTVWVYEGQDETITVTVMEDTKEILGVTCAVVRDVVEEDGEVIEDTFDWYAQDVDGNVWYFGEIARNFEDGELVDIEGSWEAGVDGAKIGILMPSQPQVGSVYRQEFALGDAEDMGEVISLTESESTPAASCDGDCLQTRDFTPLEPDGQENKYYAPGVGLILEVDTESGERAAELVQMTVP